MEEGNIFSFLIFWWGGFRNHLPDCLGTQYVQYVDQAQRFLLPLFPLCLARKIFMINFWDWFLLVIGSKNILANVMEWDHTPQDHTARFLSCSFAEQLSLSSGLKEVVGQNVGTGPLGFPVPYGPENSIVQAFCSGSPVLAGLGTYHSELLEALEKSWGTSRKWLRGRDLKMPIVPSHTGIIDLS